MRDRYNPEDEQVLLAYLRLMRRAEPLFVQWRHVGYPRKTYIPYSQLDQRTKEHNWRLFKLAVGVE